MDPLKPMLHRHAVEILPTVVRVLLLLYLVLTASHFLLMDGQSRVVMTAAAAISFGYLLLIFLSLSSQWVDDHAELILFSMVMLVGSNTVAHLYVTGDVKNTTNFVFLLAAAGYVLPGMMAFYTVALCAFVAWMLITVVGIGWGPDAAHFSFEVGMGVLFGYFLHMMRRRQLLQIEDMEQTVEKLDHSRDRIRSGESLLQRLIDTIPAGVMVRDIDRRLLYANRTAREALDLNEGDVTGLKMDQATLQVFDVSGEPLSEDESPFQRVLQTGEPQLGQVQGFRFPGGQLMWVVVNALPLEVEGRDDPVVVIGFTDITNQREIEHQLRTSESRANTILASVAEAVVQVDTGNQITLFNPAAEELTGFSVQDALGRPVDEVLLYSEAPGELMTDDASRELERLGFRAGKITRKDGSTTDVEVLEANLHDSGKVLTIRDVSQQIRIEQEQIIVDKMNSVGVLAAGIAHDFNNLLTAVYGNITLAEGHLDNRELASSYLEKSSESILLATHLTKQLLTFASGSDPVRDVVNIEKLVKESTQFTLSGSRVTPKFEVEAELLPVEIDAGQVQQAISNIVLNAKEAMGNEGEITIRISNEIPSVTGEPAFVKVVFTDRGVGMPPEMVSRIFDPYFTTKSEGNGLGLATTHSIVVKHGGSISVDSSPGEGSSFSILLPARYEQPAEAAAVNDESAEESGQLSVLVMDDEEVVLNTIVRLLEFLGHETVPTLEGQAAIDAYKERLGTEQPFDLVICDLTVAGGMGGKDAAAGILAIDPDARLVVSSGYSAGAEMARFRDFGFSARLEKPFRAADLKKLLTELFPAMGEQNKSDLHT